MLQMMLSIQGNNIPSVFGQFTDFIQVIYTNNILRKLEGPTLMHTKKPTLEQATESLKPQETLTLRLCKCWMERLNEFQQSNTLNTTTEHYRVLVFLLFFFFLFFFFSKCKVQDTTIILYMRIEL
jgi:hypothetical protein